MTWINGMPGLAFGQAAQVAGLAIAAWPLCRWWIRSLCAGTGRSRSQRLAWGLLIVAAIFPALLQGYALATRGWPPGATPWLYAGLLWGRMVPVGVLFGVLVWQRLRTPAADQVWRVLTEQTDQWPQASAARRRWWWSRELRWSVWPVVAMWLVGYQDFELAAMLKADAWADWLFMQQARGLSLAACWQHLLWPLGLQFAVLAVGRGLAGPLTDVAPMSAAVVGGVGDEAAESPVAAVPGGELVDRESGETNSLAAGVEWSQAAAMQAAKAGSGRQSRLPKWLLAVRGPRWWDRVLGRPGGGAAVAALLWCGLFVCGPLASLSRDAWAGFGVLWGNAAQWQGVTRELVLTGAVAAISGLVAWLMAGNWLGPWSSAGRSWLTAMAGGLAQGLVLIGLMGSLTIGLGFVTVLQWPQLVGIRDTPIPLCVGLVIRNLPLAWLLQRVIRGRAVAAAEQIGLAAVGGSRPLAEWLWRERDQPRLWAMAVLCYQSYLDVTLYSLLAPVGFAAGPVRLYNFMHYGRSAVLSAEALVLMLGPLAGLWLVGLVSWKVRARGTALGERRT